MVYFAVKNLSVKRTREFKRDHDKESELKMAKGKDGQERK